MRRLLACIVVLGLTGILAPSGGGAAELSCGERVLADWFENGRVDRVYPLACYEEAIAAMPTDIRDYTDAPDVIGRALMSALRGKTGVQSAEEQASKPQAESAIGAPGSSKLPLPLPLLALFGLALALLVAGALSRLGRPRREQ